MRSVVLALLVACSGSSKKPDTPPTPTELPDAAVADAAQAQVEVPPAQPAPDPVDPSELVLPAKPAGKSTSQVVIAWKLVEEGVE
jgi:hypothetical protein